MQKNNGSIFYNIKLENGEAKLIIHPDNKLDFEKYTPEIPDIFNNSSNVVNKNSRNEIKKFKNEFNLSEPIIIKKFGQQGLYDNIRFRVSKSRAFRSFKAACWLKRLEISIPQTFLAIEYRTTGNKLINSYYVCKYIDFDFDLYDVYKEKVYSDKIEELICDLAIRAKKIHDNNIIYNDFHPNNVHFKRDENDLYEMYFIDFNRVKKSKSLNLKKKAKDLFRLRIPEGYLNLFLNKYEPNSADKLAKYIKKYYQKHLKFKKLKNKLRS